MGRLLRLFSDVNGGSLPTNEYVLGIIVDGVQYELGIIVAGVSYSLGVKG